MRSYSCRPMRWWRRNAEPERSWKSGWRFWNAGIRRRERGWRDLRARCRGLRGSGDCLRHEAEQEDRIQNMTCVRTICQGGRRLVRKGMRRYVKARIAGVRFPSRRAKGLFSPPGGIGISDYSPVYFRHTPPPAIATRPSLTLEIPDFELWILELWNDFLIEPTPYLVASATIYLGFVLLVSQYYAAFWRFLCFIFQFVPWDDDYEFF